MLGPTARYTSPAAAANAWATAGTSIIQQVTAIKKQQAQAGKQPLMHAFYGANIAKYVAANTSAKELINNTPALAQSYYNTGDLPDGFLGLRWHPAYSAYALDGSGGVSSIFGDDTIVFTPDPNPQWYQFHEGSYMVPRSVDIVADAAAAARQLDIVYGMFGYAKVGHDPVSITQYAGDTFLPILADASQIVIADVTP